MEIPISVLDFGKEGEGAEREIVAVDEKELVNDILLLYQQGKSEKREREARWLEYLNAYYIRDYIPRPKWKWMSDVKALQGFYLVEYFVGILRRALLQSREFFKVSSLSPEFQGVAQALQRLAKFYIFSYNFFEEFEKALRYGVIMGEIIMKISWRKTIKKIAGKYLIREEPHFQAIDPFNIVIDPEEDRYAIERYYIPIEQAHILQEVGIWEKFPLEPYPVPSSERFLEELHERTHLTSSQTKEGLVEVKEFWGNLPIKNKVYENLHAIIVNDKYVAKAETVLLFHGEIPYIRTSLFEPVDGKWGYGIFDIIYEHLKNFTIVRRYIENSALASLGEFLEIDKTRILDRQLIQELKDKGVEPFSIIEKAGPEPVITPVIPSQFNPNVLPILQLYNQEIQNATGLTEFIMGLPTSKGRPTATEVSLKLQQNIAVMDTISTKIESKVISESIRKLLHTILQNEKDEKIRLILGDVGWQYFSSFTREELAELIEEKIAISVSGISETLHRKEKLEQLLNFLEVAQNLPNAGDLNFNFIIRKFAELLDFYPDEIFSPPAEETTRANMEALSSFIAFFLTLDVDRQKNIVNLLKLGFPPQVLISGIEKFVKIAGEDKERESERGGEEE